MVPVWAQVSLPFVWCQTKARLQDTHRWVQSRATVPYRDVLAVPIESGFPGLHFATSSAPSVALTHTCPRSESWWGKAELSPSEDGQEGPLGLLQSHGKVIQLLLHQEASCLLRKVHSHHGAVSEGDRQGGRAGQKRSGMMTSITLDTCSPVGSVSCAEGIVDVNISQFGQRRPEGVNLLLRGLSLKQRIWERCNLWQLWFIFISICHFSEDNFKSKSKILKTKNL